MSPKSSPAFSAAERAAVYRVIRERRDVRQGFTDRPLPEDVLRRILEAAHCAPSVGLMQPTRLVVLRDPALRRQVREAFTTANLEAAARYQGAQAEEYKALKLEGIVESAVNVCVLCDRSSEQGHALGRQSMPETALYSTVCAVENLWLAARAEGIGVGWVSILDPHRLCALLQIPAHLTLVAYLCMGYVDRFETAPELERLGWEKRRGLEACLAWDRCGDW